jgi:subtilisin family serine protease
VASIGNDSHGNSGSPGNAHSVLSAGAVEPVGRTRVGVAYFSSGASLVFPGQEPNNLVTKPDVVAPGAQVFSCVPPETRSDGTRWYSYMSGTSMAAPHVAGVAALLMSACPDATVPEVMRVLRETAWHPEGLDRRPDNRWGFGLIQPMNALEALQT